MSEWDISGGNMYRTPVSTRDAGGSDRGSQGNRGTSSASPALANPPASSVFFIPATVTKDRPSVLQPGLTATRLSHSDDHQTQSSRQIQTTPSEDDTSRQGQNDRRGEDGGQSGGVNKYAKGLSQAKGKLTRFKNTSYNKVGGHLSRLTETKLVELKNELDDLYLTLGKVFDQFRNHEEELYGEEAKAKAEEGIAKYESEYEAMTRELEREIRRKEPTQSTSAAAQAHRNSMNQSGSREVRRMSPHQSSSDGVSFHGFLQSDTDRAEAARDQFDQALQDVEENDHPEEDQEPLWTRAEVRSKEPMISSQSRTTSVSSGSQKSTPRQGQVRSAPARDVKDTREHLKKGKNKQNTKSPEDRLRVHPGAFNIRRFMNVIDETNWGERKKNLEMNKFLDTGLVPEEIRKIFEQTRSKKQEWEPRETGPSGRARTERTAWPVPEPTPSFVTGGNAVPLGTDRRVVFENVTQTTVQSARPVVPQPSYAPEQEDYLDPQTAPTMPYVPPAQPMPVVGRVDHGGMAGPVGNLRADGHLGQQSFAYAGAPVRTFAGVSSFPQNGWLSNNNQGGLDFSVPPPVARRRTEFFSDHSHRTKENGRPVQKERDLSHWAYNPTSYIQKPLMKMENVLFDGTAKTVPFDEFLATFEVICGGRNMPEAQKLMCLKQNLRGEPKKYVTNTIGTDLSPGALLRAIRVLEKHYGGAQRTTETYIKRLQQYPNLKSFNCDNMLDLITIVDEIYHRFKDIDPRSLESEHNLLAGHLREILPERERVAYYLKLSSHERLDTFLTLRDYLHRIYEGFRLSEITSTGLRDRQTTHVGEEERERTHQGHPEQDERDVGMALAGLELGTVPKPRGTFPPARSYTPQTTPAGGAAGATVRTCSYCSQNHQVWMCEKFKALEVRQRFDHVREKRLCFHCLLPGHRSRDCRYQPDKLCGREGCKRKHHYLVHNTVEAAVHSIEVYVVEMDMQEAEMLERTMYATQFSECYKVEEDVNFLLPLEEEYIAVKTATVEIHCGDKKRRVIVALDSCSNNTNIDAELAKELGLPILKANIQRKMKLLERTAHLQSDFVSFELSALGSNKKIPIQGYTVQNLMTGSPVIDWTATSEVYPHLKEAREGLQKPRPMDKVQILLGNEFAEFMSPYQVIRGPWGTGAPLAERTDLGWAFMGRTGMRSSKSQSFPQKTSLTTQTLVTLDLFEEGDLGETTMMALESDEEPTGARADPIPLSREKETKKGKLESLVSEFRSWAVTASQEVRMPQAAGLDRVMTEFRSWASSSFPKAQTPKTEISVRTEGSGISSLDKAECRGSRTVPSESNLRIVEVDVTFPKTDSRSTPEEQKTSKRGVESQMEGRGIIEVKVDFGTRNAETKELFGRDEELTMARSECRGMMQSTVEPPGIANPFTPVVTNQDLHLEIDGEIERELTETGNRDAERKSADSHRSKSAPENLLFYLDMPETEQSCFTEGSSQLERDQQLHDLMQKHWELEAVGLVEKAPRISGMKEPVPALWSKAEIELDNKMPVIYLEDRKQFQVSIPWKQVRPDFRNNRFAVKKRQEGTLKHLGERIGNVREIFDGYLEKGYIRKLEYEETRESDCRYLPFFCVIDESKETTPVRIVWDCKAVYDGKSLNSEIELTPNRLQDLFRVLLRLRKYEFTVTSDVSEMFLKILLDPKDRKYHRFVLDEQDYEWNVMLFGNISSPNGSQKVLSQACEMFGNDMPEAVETLQKSCYMDDTIDSRPTEARASALAKELIQLLGLCNMPIHKFYSNSHLVIRNMEPGLLAKQIHLEEKDISFDSGKVLGMVYSVDDGDVLMFNGRFKSVREWTNRSQETRVEEGKWTKRLVTKAAASIYDPHGLISPFTVRAKVIIQEIWKLKELGWDNILPPGLCKIWETWLSQVFEVPLIKIRRWSQFGPGRTAQLHTFCDASEEGMCCAVYLRVKNGIQIETTLLAAKARVSPLRAESISRLELVACIMGTRLCAAVREVYPVAAEDVFFWTDSEVCLHWINVPAKSFKAYVAHRIGEIQTHTEPRQWLHVPTAENPADVGTRPITAGELKERWLWWNGPEFLKKKMTEWPKSKVIRQIETVELKNTVFTSIEPLKEGKMVDTLEKINPRRYSVGRLYNGYQKCLRSWAYVIRAARIFRKGRRTGKVELCKEELAAAERYLIKQAQLEVFKPEIGMLLKVEIDENLNMSRPRTEKSSRISHLTPFLDETGILRSRSRLENGTIYTFDQIYPIILDRRSDVARLIVQEAHDSCEHPIGFNALKAQISRRFIITGLGTLCGQIKFQCADCRVVRGKSFSQLQAALPSRRLGENMKPFSHVGMDFAGPFEVKVGRGKPRKKVYVLVMTCMAIRAVHLEPTGGMDTTHVVNAISRFTDLRGIPESITTDNQTSFTKADKDLTDWVKQLKLEEIEKETRWGFRSGSQGIEWIFNPPLAPHFGGIFEIIVKAMKRALYATVARADLNEEEFRTVISKVAGMLNNRPIQPVGDGTDCATLTPNHFLNGGTAEAVFPPNLPRGRLDIQERLRYQVTVQEHFWKRFQTEVLPLNGPRSKWHELQRSVKEGDVVVEIDENVRRGEWRKLRVTKVFPSKDGLIRKVEVMSGLNKFYTRPVARLVPIVL